MRKKNESQKEKTERAVTNIQEERGSEVRLTDAEEEYKGKDEEGMCLYGGREGEVRHGKGLIILEKNGKDDEGLDEWTAKEDGIKYCNNCDL